MSSSRNDNVEKVLGNVLPELEQAIDNAPTARNNIPSSPSLGRLGLYKKNGTVRAYTVPDHASKKHNPKMG